MIRGGDLRDGKIARQRKEGKGDDGGNQPRGFPVPTPFGYGRKLNGFLLGKVLVQRREDLRCQSAGSKILKLEKKVKRDWPRGGEGSREIDYEENFLREKKKRCKEAKKSNEIE